MIDPKPSFALSPIDLESAVWLKLKEYLVAELADRRAYNDGHSLNEKETARVRGDIERIKKLLALGDKP